MSFSFRESRPVIRWAVFPCIFCCQKPICWHFLLTKPNFDHFGEKSFLRKKFWISRKAKKNTANQTVYGVIFCGGDKGDRTPDLMTASYNTAIFYRLISFWKVLYLQRFFRCFLIFMGYRLILWNMFVDTFCWQKMLTIIPAQQPDRQRLFWAFQG